MATAILIDGDFFIRRYRYLLGNQQFAKVAGDLHRMCLEHLKQTDGRKIRRDLYRIFFYDCPPLTKKVHNPVTKKAIDFSKTPSAVWRNGFHNELRRLRKVALRLGYVNEDMAHWAIRPDKVKDLFNGKVTVAQLTDQDVRYSAQQKGVDMRIGLDIASLAYKQQVDQIILVSGDSDFVPAAKLARREGIDFILDPMWATIRDDLHEHIDGLRSVIQPPAAAAPSAPAPAATAPPVLPPPATPPPTT
ncbi:MAG TPA: NYN domain-containing protein [Verrucomicrobiae bacterium]|jgi:uncharacterized LabA/DUF88 family protein